MGWRRSTRSGTRTSCATWAERGAYALAEKQLVLTRRQIDAGLLAESESIRSESTLARNQVDMLTYEAAIEDAADRLRQQLNLPPVLAEIADSRRGLVLIDPPFEQQADEFDLVAGALEPAAVADTLAVLPLSVLGGGQPVGVIRAAV